MAKITISDLQSINAESEQLSDLDSEVTVGGLSIIGDFCGGIEFVYGEPYTLPNGEIIRVKPIIIPCNPKPSVPPGY